MAMRRELSSRNAFLTVIQIMNALKKKHTILDYAIFGSMATMRYTQTFPTGDLDLVVVLRYKKLIDLSPVWREFRNKGHTWTEQHLLVEGIPVEIMVADRLEEEAVKTANRVSVSGLRTKVPKPEYLIAMAVRAGRQKDRFKVNLLLQQTSTNSHLLQSLLKRFGLTERFETWVK